mmetsp:Transcript_5384/g.13788  ORF Transcript_5384/g.13788 Transcript_5384/m.13788 type:complete len:248 (-) Transcript_5384:106-849(-)
MSRITGVKRPAPVAESDDRAQASALPTDWAPPPSYAGAVAMAPPVTHAAKAPQSSDSLGLPPGVAVPPTAAFAPSGAGDATLPPGVKPAPPVPFASDLPPGLVPPPPPPLMPYRAPPAARSAGGPSRSTPMAQPSAPPAETAAPASKHSNTEVSRDVVAMVPAALRVRRPAPPKPAPRPPGGGVSRPQGVGTASSFAAHPGSGSSAIAAASPIPSAAPIPPDVVASAKAVNAYGSFLEDMKELGAMN